jgi:hypothetical protein
MPGIGFAAAEECARGAQNIGHNRGGGVSLSTTDAGRSAFRTALGRKLRSGHRRNLLGRQCRNDQSIESARHHRLE